MQKAGQYRPPVISASFLREPRGETCRYTGPLKLSMRRTSIVREKLFTLAWAW